MTKMREIHTGDLLLEGPETTDTEGGSIVKTYSATPSDPSLSQWMRLQETSGAFDFWNRPEEDIYSSDDGEPA